LGGVAPASHGAALDRAKELAMYAREQVSHAWLTDPITHTFGLLGLAGGRWTNLATHAGAEVVRADPFAEGGLDLRALWDDPEEGQAQGAGGPRYVTQTVARRGILTS
jgi:hypothetical protein